MVDLSTTFKNSLVQLAQSSGFVLGENGWSDEHERFKLYRCALHSDGERALLLNCLAMDEDVAMVTSVIFDLIEVSGAQDWGPLLKLAPEPTKASIETRVVETELVRSVRSGDDRQEVLDAIVTASDWAQREALRPHPSTALVDVLARQGRTKRIRNEARRHHPDPPGLVE